MTGNCKDCRNEATCTKMIGIWVGFCSTDFQPWRDEKMRITLTEKEIQTLIEAVHDLADEYEQIFDACEDRPEDTAARRKQFDEMLAVARKLKGKLMRRKGSAA